MLQPSQLNLWKAAQNGDEAATRRALGNGTSVLERNRLGWNTVHRACMSGNLDVLRLVLAASENADDGQKNTPRAALLAAVDGEGNSPLHVAAGCSHLSIVQELLQAGADISLTTKHGGTPMHACCEALADTKEQPGRFYDVVLALLSAPLRTAS